MLVGTGLAVRDGHAAQIGLVAVTLLACILIHAGTNLQNDVGDFYRGADLAGRIGPPRATTEGWLPARQVQAAATACFGLAVVPGALLAAWGGWPIVWIGIASIVAGAAYTAGPRPIAYSGWGEFFVVLFFGLVAVGGIYYLHAGSAGPMQFVAGLAVGLLAAAVLVVNNLRDIDSDRRIGKNTLAVRRGLAFSVREYALLLHLPFALALVLAAQAQSAALLMPWLVLPWATWLWLNVRRAPAGAWLNTALASTSKLGLAFALLLGLGVALA